MHTLVLSDSPVHFSNFVAMACAEGVCQCALLHCQAETPRKDRLFWTLAVLFASRKPFG